jgi:hypothetical protein
VCYKIRQAPILKFAGTMATAWRPCMVLGCDTDELKQRGEGICLPFFVVKNRA